MLVAPSPEAATHNGLMPGRETRSFPTFRQVRNPSGLGCGQEDGKEGTDRCTWFHEPRATTQLRKCRPGPLQGEPTSDSPKQTPSL